MNVYSIIDKYYSDNAPLRELLLLHSRLVMSKALYAAVHHPSLNIDLQFVAEASMLHDIGIFLTDAPGIHCHGSELYIRHGVLGAELLRKEHLPEAFARVCERHTGAGLSCNEITKQHLPLENKDLLPETIEEKLVCYADKFYSKSHPTVEKTYERAIVSLARFGEEGVTRFREWHSLFA